MRHVPFRRSLTIQERRIHGCGALMSMSRATAPNGWVMASHRLSGEMSRQSLAPPIPRSREHSPAAVKAFPITILPIPIATTRRPSGVNARSLKNSGPGFSRRGKPRSKVITARRVGGSWPRFVQPDPFLSRRGQRLAIWCERDGRGRETAGVKHLTEAAGREIPERDHMVACGWRASSRRAKTPATELGRGFARSGWFRPAGDVPEPDNRVVATGCEGLVVGENASALTRPAAPPSVRNT